MDNNNNSSVEDGGNKKRKSDDISDNNNNSNSITSAATHLHSLLIAKEKELKEKEEDFDKRVKLYESKHPSTGTDTDILQLNVGGSTSISVRRSTLTQFPDTLLAATFSGRWDESMEKDRDGNIFIDQDPENFLLLVNYLRLRMNNQSRKVPEKYLPKPTYPLCYMLDYYGLMPAVYLQTWNGSRDKKISDEFTCEEKSYGAYELSTKTEDDNPVNFLYKLGLFANAGVSEFTVEFDKGTGGIVGWFCTNHTSSIYTLPDFNDGMDNHFLLDIADRKLYDNNGGLREENLKIAHMASVTKVVCTYDGHETYSIHVVDESGQPVCGGSDTLEKRMTRRLDHRVIPMISFYGKVTVSGLKYAIDEL